MNGAEGGLPAAQISPYAALSIRTGLLNGLVTSYSLVTDPFGGHDMHYRSTESLILDPSAHRLG